MGTDAPICPVNDCDEYAHMPVPVRGPNGMELEVLMCLDHWKQFAPELPVTPASPKFPRPYREPLSPPFVEKPRCGACGLALEPVMGYVCSRVPCPTGLGGPTC